MTHLSLFSGVGGVDLAAEWAGFETVGQCEIDDYASRVLYKHWPDVPRWRDIRDVTQESFRERTGMGTVDIISGGCPCQPFSVAGNQKGKEDERYLWPEMLRVIRELKPRWVLCENVSGILRIAGDIVCEDLERSGYAVGIFDFEAAAIGAPHKRERIFFVANANDTGNRTLGYDTHGQREAADEGRQGQSQRRLGGYSAAVADAGIGAFVSQQEPQGLKRQAGFTGGGYGGGTPKSVIPNADGGRGVMRRNGELPTITSVEGSERHNGGRTPEYVTGQRREFEPGLGGVAYELPAGLDGCLTFPPEPNIPRIASNVPNRANRLKCLGNAVVPAQVYPILRAIAITIKEAEQHD
jgi:DNA (cytosine-5)-methyltransferase 1